MVRKTRLLYLCLTVVASVICVTCGSAHAARWTLSKGLATSLVGTQEDNAETNPEDTVQSVGNVSPYLVFIGDGNRSDVTLRASVGYRRKFGDDISEVSPRLSFESSNRVFERILTVDTVARMSDRVLTNDLQIEDALVGTGATTRLREFSVTPILKLSFKNDIDFRAYYRLSSLQASTDGESVGSNSNEVTSEISHASHIGIISSLRAVHRETEFDSNETSRTSSLSGSFAYPIARRMIARVAGGYETLQVDALAAEEKGRVWNIGLNWNPTKRMIFDFAYGERLFGNTPSVLLTLKGRRTSLQISWLKELAFSRDSNSDNLLTSTDAAVDDGADSLDGMEPSTIFDNTTELVSPLVRDARAIDQKAGFLYTVYGRLSEISGSAYWYDRNQMDTGDKVNTRTLELRYMRALTRTISTTLTLTRRDSTVFLDGIDSKNSLNRVGIILDVEF